MAFENTANVSGASASGRQTLRKLASGEDADADSVNVTLFRNAKREACGWYIGPLRFHKGRFVLPFLPESEETMASLAVVRAIEVAKGCGHPVCVIDPENLWTTVWRG